MGKFDVIDITFICLISFYLLVFTIILFLLIRKHHGIRGLFRYLLDQNAITITNSGEVIDHTDKQDVESKNKKKLSKKSKTTIKEFFEKRLKTLKKEVVANNRENIKDDSKKLTKSKNSASKKPSSKSSIKNKKTTPKKKKSTTPKKKTTTVKSKTLNKKPSSKNKTNTKKNIKKTSKK